MNLRFFNYPKIFFGFSLLLALFALTQWPRTQAQSGVTWTHVQGTQNFGTSGVSNVSLTANYYNMAKTNQTLTAGAGYFEWTVGGMANVTVGFGSGANVTPAGAYNDLNFTIEIGNNPANATVWKNPTGAATATYQGDITGLAAGQVLRIQIETNGDVTFKRNGTELPNTRITNPTKTYPYFLVFKTQDEGTVLQNINNALISGSAPDTTAPIITAVSATGTTTSGTNISWTTNEASDTQVFYGLTTSYGSSTTLNTAMVTAHAQSLSGLTPNTLYNYQVRSRDAAGNLGLSPNMTFTTSADTTAPVISGISATSVTTTGATINWTTNEASDTQIFYGPTTSYGSSTTLNTALVTAHTQSLSGLTPGTLYNFQVRSRDAAGNLASSTNQTFTTQAASSVNGLLDTNQTLLPSPTSSYPTAWTPPAKGLTYVDSVFGTTITRLTDTIAYGDGIHHEYAKMTPANITNTRFLVQSDNTGFFIIDQAGNIVVSAATLNLNNSSQPRWSATNANVLYFRQYDDNKVYKYDLSTGLKTVEATFSQYTEIDFGGGEAAVSYDGDHLPIFGYAGTRDANTGAWSLQYGHIYTISTKTLSTNRVDFQQPCKAGDPQIAPGYPSPSSCPIPNEARPDNAMITPSNGLLVRWGRNRTGPTVPKLRGQGHELYDLNLNFVRQVTDWGNHADVGRDTNGDDILLTFDSAAYNLPTGCENSGIEKVRMADASRTCIVPLNYSFEVHVGWNTAGSPWAVISTTDVSGTASMPGFGFATSTWQSLWGPRFNEVLMVNVATGERRRLAHHRSFIIPYKNTPAYCSTASPLPLECIQEDYWWQPHAAITRDGKYAIYSSNYGRYQPTSAASATYNPGQPIPNFTDVFMIKLTNP